MAPPPVKKQKTARSPPIIFTTPGIKPDVCLYIFDKEFHVSSLSLKLNAAFFRKWLEPSGGKLSTSSRPEFASEWFTKVDADGSWALTSDSNIGDTTMFPHVNPSQEERAFQNLLCAIFNRPYCIVDTTELNIMTQMADYYCMLPTLSNSVSATFFSSPGLMKSLRSDPCQLLVSAYKLRHALLFRESLIYVLGPWSRPQFQELKDHPDPSALVLFSFVDAIHTRFSSKVTELQQTILQMSTGYFSAAPYSPSYCTAVKKMLDFTSTSVDENQKLMLPRWFRQCLSFKLSNYRLDEAVLELHKLLVPFLTNSLVLDKTAVVGEGDFAGSFLCFNISDAELPWDQTQFDW